MEIPTDQLRSLYNDATKRKKELFTFYIQYMAIALFCITAITLVFDFDYKTLIIVGAFLIYALSSTVVAVMAFFNDTYFDISQSLKDTEKGTN